MHEGFYTIASGVLMQERAIGALSNNIVNVNTPGYRASRVVATTFEAELLRVEQGMSTPIGRSTPISVVSEAPTKFDQSSLGETGRPFDLAINGEGFFTIQAFAGEEGAQQDELPIYLTRNGNFDVDDENFLVLRGVGRVMGTEGEIELSGANFSVTADGKVYDSDGKYIDDLLLTAAGANEQIERVDNSLFQLVGEAEGVAVEGSTVVQGWLERSNIDINREYAMIMEAQRAFQSCSTALQIIDKINQKAASQIASL